MLMGRRILQGATVIILLSVSVLNLAYVGWYVMHFPNRPELYSYISHDYPQTLPLPQFRVEMVSMIIEESVHYPLNGTSSDDEWDSLSSAGYGYVRLGPDNRLFAVTMFHELHCLRMLNFAFGKASIATQEHIKHCLDYLRAGVLCKPDLSLEPGDFEQRDFEMNRIGATHTCRDWGPIYDVMNKNYYAWKEGST